MNGFQATVWRTYVRTDGRESLGLQRLRRETKTNQIIPVNQSEEKWENLILNHF